MGKLCGVREEATGAEVIHEPAEQWWVSLSPMCVCVRFLFVSFFFFFFLLTLGKLTGNSWPVPTELFFFFARPISFCLDFWLDNNINWRLFLYFLFFGLCVFLLLLPVVVVVVSPVNHIRTGRIVTTFTGRQRRLWRGQQQRPHQ